MKACESPVSSAEGLVRSNEVDDSGQELEDIPPRLGWERVAAARGLRVAENLPGALLIGSAVAPIVSLDFGPWSRLRVQRRELPPVEIE